MHLLKIVFGLVLMLSLVLPLSTCTGVIEEGGEKQAERTERYILSEEGSASEWLWAFVFAIPFGIAVAIGKSKPSIKSEILCLLSVAPASYVLWGHGVTGMLASGGIVALASIIGFIVVTAICLTKVSTGKIKAPAALPH